MAGEEQRINCGGRRKELEHGATLEAILYNLTLGNGMRLDEGCRGDGVNQHPQITVSFEENNSNSQRLPNNSTTTTKGLSNNGNNKHRAGLGPCNNGGISNFLQVPQPDLSKLSVMPCHECSH
ncbi:unnamed protein product [Orchesella dallaii]|uniref:Uncharacterized protein n=1 Tax=Orchesella dallaii TaxID=48710 RepID=A0ABP1S950_9HEXA